MTDRRTSRSGPWAFALASLFLALITSGLLALAPTMSEESAVSTVATGDAPARSIEIHATHQSLLASQGFGVLTVLAIPVAICLVSIALARLTRSHLAFGVAAVLLTICCVLGAASIGLFFLPSAALLAFSAGRTMERRTKTSNR
jgi:hypothetical protein